MTTQLPRTRNRLIIPSKKKSAFVCSGGGAKAGAFHLGVALALQEKGFKFIGGLKRAEYVPSPKDIQVYVGSSAGSIICSYLAGGYRLEQIFDTFLGKAGESPEDGRALKRLTYGTMFSIKPETSMLEALVKLKWLKASGLFSTAGIEKYLREDVLPSNDFQSYNADLFVVATQLNHPKKIVFGKHRYISSTDEKRVLYINNAKISQACAASTALPFIFTPYPIKNDSGNTIYYFDGEIRDTLSTHVGYDAGADLIISSYTHQPYHFQREIGSLHEYGITAVLIQALYLVIERKIQSAATTQERSLAALDATSQFFKDHGLPEHLRKECLTMLEGKLGRKVGVDYIYIHPHSTDHQMFFGDHFNLSANKMSEIVKIGFRSAIDTLRRYEFA